ncbi:hypothetical protein PN465_22550 [Nodularia spumigena CS-584]|jgi:hypothetical protein|uniref:Uncharacterized protein n=2 Tax=Nodularia spumigena TaxID=70799 RepID=A0A2S0Q9J3_NODSP|nr:hypothetical protein [Nodularia spumigena]AHJ31518.1 hypothetical protein NSP_52300 [Nodularia spumigena CCY9414]AVZ31037.1 hypothetical protein BMF81_03325 [Nodularia spumigena UHCC 0039]EAW46858.1 hypothetical protein N9414_24013 [Nodularia spumigena CCY9414]MDB9384970.1 hypothetical protein [Nodularia spumigena CS-584]MEA5524763.1 hypothetical protein [Nodularia spumigena UHCC 0143]
MLGKSLTLIGTALTLALTTNVALAESNKSSVAESDSLSMNAPTEIKLSPEGMKILCERSPLNSRCPGGTALIPPTSGGISVPLLDSNTTPENTTPAETLMPEVSDPNSSSTPAPEPLMQNEFEFQSEPNPQ